MTDNTTTTPDAISSDALKDLHDKASLTDDEKFFRDLVNRGYEMIETLSDEEQYGEFNDVQALALQAVRNLRIKYEQYCTTAAEQLEESAGSPRHLMLGLRTYSRLDTAFDLIKACIVNLDD